MKAVSYSLFKSGNEPYEFMAYLRGCYFNARMNRLVYPEWKTLIHIDIDTLNEYKEYFNDLIQLFNLEYHIYYNEKPELCKGMLRRINPLNFEKYSVIISRDLDSITTYKEAQCVEEWINTGYHFHGITDNTAHNVAMMGGMIGIKREGWVNNFSQHKVLNDLTDGFDLSKHGSDQVLIAKRIQPVIQSSLFVHALAGSVSGAAFIRKEIKMSPLSNVRADIWESNLIIRHIGSAGVNELETIRFFKRHDDKDCNEFEVKHKNICYWKQ